MTRGGSKGVNAQRIAVALAHKLARVAGIASIESVCQGAEGGREFTFIINSRDGGVVLVSAYQVELPPIDFSSKPPPTQAKNFAEARQARWFEAQEKRRKRWLGEA